MFGPVSSRVPHRSPRKPFHSQRAQRVGLQHCLSLRSRRRAAKDWCLCLRCCHALQICGAVKSKGSVTIFDRTFYPKEFVRMRLATALRDQIWERFAFGGQK